MPSFLSCCDYFYSHDILLHRKVKVSCLITEILHILAHNLKSNYLESKKSLIKIISRQALQGTGMGIVEIRFLQLKEI